jgi:hypothetical protein
MNPLLSDTASVLTFAGLRPSSTHHGRNFVAVATASVRRYFAFLPAGIGPTCGSRAKLAGSEARSLLILRSRAGHTRARRKRRSALDLDPPLLADSTAADARPCAHRGPILALTGCPSRPSAFPLLKADQPRRAGVGSSQVDQSCSRSLNGSEGWKCVITAFLTSNVYDLSSHSLRKP